MKHRPNAPLAVSDHSLPGDEVAAMTEEGLRIWLDAYGRVWERRDPDAVLELFADDAVYHETPFSPPLCGRDAIREYWRHVQRSQNQIRFSYESLTIDGNRAVAHWSASFVRIPSGIKVKLDGIFLLTFNAEGRCQTLREWWQKQES